MSKSKAPAFQLYAGDFLTDVMDWTDEEVGVHCRLLFWSWANKQGIPSEMERLCRIARGAKRCWKTVGTKWTNGPEGTFINERLEITRKESEAFRARQKAKSDLAVAARSYRLSDEPTGVSTGVSTGSSTDDPLEGEGGDSITQGRKERERVTLFATSGITIEDVQAASPSLVDEGVDLKHYFEAITNWSDAKDIKRNRRGWLATFRQWTKTDRDKGELKIKAKATAGGWHR